MQPSSVNHELHAILETVLLQNRFLAYLYVSRLSNAFWFICIFWKFPTRFLNVTNILRDK